jgi:hypothetical protein
MSKCAPALPSEKKFASLSQSPAPLELVHQAQTLAVEVDGDKATLCVRV